MCAYTRTLVMKLLILMLALHQCLSFNYQCGCRPHTGPSIANSPICQSKLPLLTTLEKAVTQRCDISDPCRRVADTGDAADKTYDFIVVGSGTAGSVVAGRLAENADFNVLLIEAGGQDPVGSRVPAFYGNFANNNESDWMYRTVPADYCLNDGSKGCAWARGKGVGGSSILNGMMYHRGHRADFENWQAAGATEWGWEQNLPFFLMSEDNRQLGLVSPEYHASGGPMPIGRFRYQPSFTFEILKAATEAGFPVISDINDPRTPAGFGFAQTFAGEGQRVTTARAYIERRYNKARNNLHVALNAHVSKVLFNGTRATGVQYLKNGVTKTVYASKEVIISAGTLNTPQILLLSGIGPADVLQQFDIPSVANLPVGRNLLNHIGASVYFVADRDLNNPDVDWEDAAEYLRSETGEFTSTGITQVTGILYSRFADRARQQPDLQLFNYFNDPCPTADEPSQAGRRFGMSTVALLPRSVGYVTLNSTDPLDAPLFYANYFSDPHDMNVVKDAILKAKTLVESKTFQSYGVKWDDSYDGCDGSGTIWSDPWLECVARYYTDPQNHQQGTAAIGSVVDQELRVYNVTGLRVVDASVMPTLLTGNPQGVIMMVAERAAFSIKAQWA